MVRTADPTWRRRSRGFIHAGAPPPVATYSAVDQCPVTPRAALLALLLPLGSVINVAVAWTGALFSDLASGKPCELYAVRND